MIHDVDESLRELLQRDVVNGANVDLSFDAPTKDWSSRLNRPTLNTYLYDIREDLLRRQVQPVEGRDQRQIVTDRRFPLRRFKLSYMATAWTQRPEDEHRLLSALLSCFIAFDALPMEILQGELARIGDPVRTTIGLPLPADRSVSDVWSALGGELKPSLDLIVTAPFQTGRQREVGPPVLDPQFSFSGSSGPVEVVGSPATPRELPVLEDDAEDGGTTRTGPRGRPRTRRDRTSTAALAERVEEDIKPRKAGRRLIIRNVEE